MTQIGKCDICRLRKVKCDEAKPVCNACRKKNRPCTYTYGKSTAIVRDYSNHLSRHGTRVMPSVSPLPSSPAGYPTPPESHSDLRLTMRKEAVGGHGVFQTFALVNKPRSPGQRRLQSQDYEDLVKPTIPARPSTPNLAARCAYLFGPRSWEPDSRSIHGSWIETIPSRIGSSSVFDFALEFALNSIATFRNSSFSAKRAALVSRQKALGTLRAAVENYRGKPSYDMMLATKLHSLGEIFIEGGTLAYSTHCVGLSEQLKFGTAPGLEHEHHWSLVDHTYVDEVTEAILTGRPSMFDTPLYLRPTAPSTSQEAEGLALEFRREAKAIMHCTIQLPRLSCLIRRSIEKPSDTEILSSALSLANTIWALSPSTVIDQVFTSSTTKVQTSPSPTIADILPESFRFDSVQALLICTRFWSLQIHICAFIQTLWSHFPEACAAAPLPPLPIVHEVDIQAARSIEQSLPSALQHQQTLPLVPLRVLGPLSLSVGPWYRLAQRLRLCSELESLEPDSADRVRLEKELEDAITMEDCVIEQCNCIHDSWGVGRADKARFEMMIPVMSGGKMPEWMPNRVGWEEARARMRRQGAMVGRHVDLHTASKDA